MRNDGSIETHVQGRDYISSAHAEPKPASRTANHALQSSICIMYLWFSRSHHRVVQSSANHTFSHELLDQSWAHHTIIICSHERIIM